MDAAPGSIPVSMTKHQYITVIAEAVASRSTCPKSKVGAVFVNDEFEIVATGYNGAPAGFPHCEKTNCSPDLAGKCTVAVHAEMNAMLQAAKRGTSLKGTKLFVLRWPCARCAMSLVSCGIQGVYVPWHGKDCPEGKAVLKQARIDGRIVSTDGLAKPAWSFQ